MSTNQSKPPNYSESQKMAENIRIELQRLRDSQAELASAMLQFLQADRADTRATKASLQLMLNSIEEWKVCHPFDGPQIIAELEKQLRDLYES